MFDKPITPGHWAFWIPHFAHMSCTGVITQYSPKPAERERHKQRGIWRIWFYLWDFDGHIEITEVTEVGSFGEVDIPTLK